MSLVQRQVSAARAWLDGALAEGTALHEDPPAADELATADTAKANEVVNPAGWADGPCEPDLTSESWPPGTWMEGRRVLTGDVDTIEVAEHEDGVLVTSTDASAVRVGDV